MLALEKAEPFGQPDTAAEQRDAVKGAVPVAQSREERRHQILKIRGYCFCPETLKVAARTWEFQRSSGPIAALTCERGPDADWSCGWTPTGRDKPPN